MKQSTRRSVNLISKEGDMLSLLKRMEKSHTVKAYVEGDNHMYDGMIHRVHDINEFDMQEDDLILFDMVGGGKGADVLKKRRLRVVGAGEINDKLELDREFGMRFMKKYCCNIPPSIFVDSIEEARQVVADTGKRYVFKPSGNLNTCFTHVSTSAEELLRMMDYFEDNIPPGTEIVLQEFVEGIEMSTEAWFNGERFLLPINSTFEEKKFLAGNLGANTGCMGNVVWYWDEEMSEKLYNMLFKKMEEPLREGGYLGPLDINAIWTERGPMGLEFTARFGYDAIQCSSRLLEMEFGEFLYSLPDLSEVPARTDSYGMAVRVSIPPFPNDGEVPEVPVDVSMAPQDTIYLGDVYLRDGKMFCAGVDGYIVCVADHGKRLGTLSSKIYDILESLEIPGKQYRIDISDRAARDREKVTEIINNFSLTIPG